MIYNILKCIPMLLVTILILLFWIDPFIAFIATFLGALLIIPSIIAVVCITIASRRMVNKSQKFMFGWGLFIVLFSLVYLTFQYPRQQCDATIMAKHYEEKAKDMEQFISYLDRALDDSASVKLEFEYGKASIFHVAAKGDSVMSCHWDDAEEKKDSLMQVVGLTPVEYDKIHNFLRSLDCIGAEMTKAHLNAETVINFRRVGMGMYSFVLYNTSISSKEKEEFMSNYMYIPYNDKAVFMYQGGGFGRQAFPSEEKEAFLKEHKPW